MPFEQIQDTSQRQFEEKENSREKNYEKMFERKPAAPEPRFPLPLQQVMIDGATPSQVVLQPEGGAQEIILHGSNLSRVSGAEAALDGVPVKDVVARLLAVTKVGLRVQLQAAPGARANCCYSFVLLVDKKTLPVTESLLRIKVESRQAPLPTLVPMSPPKDGLPAAPSNLTCLPVKNPMGMVLGMQLAWTDNASNEVGFRVERASQSGRTWESLVTLPPDTTRYYHRIEPPSGRPGFYRVAALGEAETVRYADNFSCGGPGGVVSPAGIAPSSLLVLPSPTDLRVRPQPGSSGRLLLTWVDPSTLEEGYRVLRASEAGGPFAEVAVRGANQTQYLDGELVPLSPCTTYFYRVEAFRAGAGSNAASASATTAPPAPTGLLASQGTQVGKIYLDWNTVACADHYRVYELTSANGTYTPLGDAPNNLADITNVPPYISIFYKVASVDAAGTEGELSAHAVGWAAAALAPPNNLWASQGNYTDRIQLQWDRAVGATAYQVYSSTAISGTYEALSTPTTLAAVSITNVAPNVAYYFRVASLDSAGNRSNPSTSVMGWAGSSAGQVLPAPTGLQASDGVYPDRVAVSWQPVAGAVRYHLYRASDPFFFAVPPPFVVTGNSFVDTTVYSGAGYFYRAAAVNASGVEGRFSNYDGGYAAHPVPYP